MSNLRGGSLSIDGLRGGLNWGEKTEDVLIEGISLYGASYVSVGGTTTLTLSLLPSGASERRTVTWSSSNTSYATVNNGVVTGIAPGSVTITCTVVTRSGNTFTATHSLDVAYGVTYALTNVSSSNTAVYVLAGYGYTTTLSASSGRYLLEDDVVITIDGEEVGGMYDDSTKTIAIDAEDITGDIVITARARALYTITYSLTNATSSTTDTTVYEGHAYLTKVTANTGYQTSSVTITMGGADITSSAYRPSGLFGNVVISEVTGNVVITWVATAAVYSVTYDLTDVTSSSSVTSVSYGDSYTTTLTAATALSGVSVTMGGVDVTSTYYNSSTQTITIASVTGAIVITAAAASLISSTSLNDGGTSWHFYNGSTLVGSKSYGNANVQRATDMAASGGTLTAIFYNSGESAVSIGTLLTGAIYPVNCTVYDDSSTAGTIHPNARGKCSDSVAHTNVGSVPAGGSLQVDGISYTAGTYPAVWLPSGLTCELYGNYDAADIPSESDGDYTLTTSSSGATACILYSDGGDTQLVSAGFYVSVYLTDVFASDTNVKVTVYNANTTAQRSNLAGIGCFTSSSVTEGYYAVALNGAFVAEAMVEQEYTVKAGYRLGIACRSGMTPIVNDV